MTVSNWTNSRAISPVAWRRLSRGGVSPAPTDSCRRRSRSEARLVAPMASTLAGAHPLIRLGLRHALSDVFEVCAEAEDADSAVEAARREKPDICLIDVSMPGNGIQAAARIVAELPGVAVVMISAASDDATLF